MVHNPTHAFALKPNCILPLSIFLIYGFWHVSQYVFYSCPLYGTENRWRNGGFPACFATHFTVEGWLGMALAGYLCTSCPKHCGRMVFGHYGWMIYLPLARWWNYKNGIWEARLLSAAEQACMSDGMGAGRLCPACLLENGLAR